MAAPRPKRIFRKRRPTAAHYNAPARSDAGEESRGVRLQKLLASAGLGSRRECEEIIQAGRVDIDGETVTELGVRVDPKTQKVLVDGESIKAERRAYYVVNKPSGVLSTNRDPAGRIRVVDLIDGHQRLFTVGRLDLYSEGLIIVTNDGELTQRLTHPRYGVPKVYQVQVAGAATNELAEKLMAGVHLAEGFAKATKAFVKSSHKNCTQLEMVLTEGRNREIRRMLAAAGHKVQRLTRIAVGPVRLGKLKPGQYRALDADEVNALRDAAFGNGAEPTTRRPRRAARPDRSPHKPPFRSDDRAAGQGERVAKPREFNRDRPPRRDEAGKRSGDRTATDRTLAGRAVTGRPAAGRPGGGRPAMGRGKPPRFEDRPRTGGRPPRDRRAIESRQAAPTPAPSGQAHPLPFLRKPIPEAADDASSAGTPQAAGGAPKFRRATGKPSSIGARPFAGKRSEARRTGSTPGGDASAAANRDGGDETNGKRKRRALRPGKRAKRPPRGNKS
jgi:23S rRNA pseudouridine2605 synthase